MYTSGFSSAGAASSVAGPAFAEAEGVSLESKSIVSVTSEPDGMAAESSWTSSDVSGTSSLFSNFSGCSSCFGSASATSASVRLHKAVPELQIYCEMKIKLRRLHIILREGRLVVHPGIGHYDLCR